MGDNQPRHDGQDGSRSAAQGAPEPEPDQSRVQKFLHRLFAGRDDAPAEGPVASAGQGGNPSPGLGNLRRLRVEDVAIPRAEIVSAPIDIALDDLVSLFRESGLSRLPVFRGTLDHPLGMIHLKDLALKYGFNGRPNSFDLEGLVRPVLYAPPSMPVGVLLQKMQTERIHMCLVIDEYGGVDGLVTLEDLIETVIGEIADEHDTEEETFWTEEAPGVFLAQARTPLEEFEEGTGAQLSQLAEEDEVDTLGGLVFSLSGRVPVRGEVIEAPDGTEFEVVDADPRRIKRLRVCLPASKAA